MMLAQAEQGKADAQRDKVMVDMQIAQSKEERENFQAQQDAQQQQFDQWLKTQQATTSDLSEQIKSLGLLLEKVGPGALVTHQAGLVIESQQES